MSMTMTSDNLKLAKSKLQEAYQVASCDNYRLNSKFKDQIFLIVTGTHLTFRYILINALLAKSTFPYINPLCLQKGATLKGAYDARSLGHKVLVPFEREFLSNVLGGSNEPFLNKPARFTSLDVNNPVRKGADKEKLNILCNILPQLDAKEAFAALTDALKISLDIIEAEKVQTECTIFRNSDYKSVEVFFNALLKESFGGEVLAITVGTLVKVFCMNLKGEIRTEVHVVNQAGSSSKEISDIDVYQDELLLYTIEAKDKIYSPEDVIHAVNKASKNNSSRLIFVEGPRGSLNDSTHEELVEKASEYNIFLTFINSKAFVDSFLSLMPIVDTSSVISLLLETSKQIRSKKQTKSHILKTAKELGLIVPFND